MALNEYVTCDKCECVGLQWINYGVGTNTVIRLAKKKGWQVGKKGWFCPACRTQIVTINKENKNNG